MPRNKNWTLEQQLLSSRRIDGNCWRWTGCLSDGYGRLRYKWKNIGAHKASAILYLGLSPDSAQWVLHKNICPNRDCFNPEHLYLGDVQQNIRDAVEKGTHNSAREKLKTHCSRGHAYSSENTLKDVNGHRRCRECHNTETKRATRLAELTKRVLQLESLIAQLMHQHDAERIAQYDGPHVREDSSDVPAVAAEVD